MCVVKYCSVHIQIPTVNILFQKKKKKNLMHFYFLHHEHHGAFILSFQSPCWEHHNHKWSPQIHVWTVKQALSSWLGRKFSALFKMEAIIFLHQKCIYHLLEMRSGTFWRKFPQRMGTKSFPGYLITVSVCLGVFQVPLPLTCQNMWGLLALTATWIKSDWQGIQLRSNSEFNRPEFLW